MFPRSKARDCSRVSTVSEFNMQSNMRARIAFQYSFYIHMLRAHLKPQKRKDEGLTDERRKLEKPA